MVLLSTSKQESEGRPVLLEHLSWAVFQSTPKNYNGRTLSRTAATGVVPLQFKVNAKTPKYSSTLYCIRRCRERLYLHFCFSEVMANFYVPLHTKHTELSSSNLDQRKEASSCQYMRFSIIQNWQKSQVPSAWHDI